MSEEDLVPTLTRSPSGPIRPKKRPPLKNNSSSNRLTEEDITDLLMKESSFNESTNEQKSYQKESTNKNDLEDSDEDTAKEGDEASETDSNCDNDSEIELQKTDNQIDQKLTNTSSNENVTDKCKKIFQKQEETIRGNKTVGSILNSYQGISRSVIIVAVVLCLLGMIGSYCIVSSVNNNHTIDLNMIKNEFPTQNEDLWIAFEAGVQDVVNFSRPSTFIFLYEKEGENTLENLLDQLTKYAVCEITHCSKEPIIVTDTELNSSEIVEDYGRLIHKYRNKLEENGVMIIKHIENVQGISAQAFHSFCDEFSPLVDKSLFIFTMNVGKLNNQNEVNFVEEYFRNKWTDIKVDIFNALITRITSMVLEIRP